MTSSFLASAAARHHVFKYANVWNALYDAININGLSNSNVATIPAAVAALGRIPVKVIKYINNAFALGLKITQISSAKIINFLIPNINYSRSCRGSMHWVVNRH